ncbi:M28 family peptidase [Flavobacterium sp. NG2]|uniref:M28 family peptidase n=1 Tax=Flavobacterium sp. NG2 TaxID=3097547 RepID=UPI002A81B18B|nr:M28 family peptidase [Flavobacterium sp. NG2]WPR72932.1 M28 family peptidase [Flavobacterium sp. NG2]
MKKTLVLSLLLLTLSCANTKRTDNKLTTDASKYLNTITAEELKTHVFTIAADTMEGRDTGSIGQKKAGNYLISFYQENKISHPKNQADFYQKIPSQFLKTRSGQILNASENICAFIEGTEKPEEIIIISAHYDHIGKKKETIFNGADDNASGTSSLLEIAQAFQIAKNEGHGPKRSILFLHLTGEEHGLLGSSYYTENPIFPLKNTVSDINIDMIGRRDAEHPSTNNYVYVIGADRLSTELHNIVLATNEKYTQLDLNFKFNDPRDPNHYYERSDHYNFAKHRIPSVFFFNGVHADYHRPTDTADKIEYDALAKRAQLAFVVAWELANRENRITVDR